MTSSVTIRDLPQRTLPARLMMTGPARHVDSVSQNAGAKFVHGSGRRDLVFECLALSHQICVFQWSRPSATAPWTRKYISPGGYIPGLSEVLAAVEEAGLWVTDLEIWRRRYAATLLAWDRQFQANRNRAHFK